MSLALVHSRARAGVDAPLVRVEVHLSGSLPVTQIVGLAETSVRESRERVRAVENPQEAEAPNMATRKLEGRRVGKDCSFILPAEADARPSVRTEIARQESFINYGS